MHKRISMAFFFSQVLLVGCGVVVPAASQVFAQETANPADGQPAAAQNSEKIGTEGGVASEAAQAKSPETKGWKPVLPKEGLKGWEKTDFGGEGSVEWDGKTLVVAAGEPMTGIHYTGKDFPTTNYEIRFEVQRVEGSDFFCGLTFPVGDEFCSWIVGGWGGGLVGLSNVDGFDASENSTSNYTTFESDRWYKLRLLVSDDEIITWIDDKKYCHQDRDHHKFSTRIEVYICQPLGYTTYRTKAAVRGWEFRKLDKATLAKLKADRE